MTANYQRPAFAGSLFKAPRGSRVLEREKQDRATAEAEKAVSQEVKRLDGRCRWPERHKCRGALEAAHIHDKSIGGDTTAEDLITVCQWFHRRGPESIHGKQLEVRPLTKAGTRGPCAFYRKRFSETRKGEFTWRLVAKETQPGVVEP